MLMMVRSCLLSMMLTLWIVMSSSMWSPIILDISLMPLVISRDVILCFFLWLVMSSFVFLWLLVIPRLSSLLRTILLLMTSWRRLYQWAVLEIILAPLIYWFVFHRNFSKQIVMSNYLKSAHFQILESIVVANHCQLSDVSCCLNAWEYFVVVTRNDSIINFLQNVNPVIVACNIHTGSVFSHLDFLVVLSWINTSISMAMMVGCAKGWAKNAIELLKVWETIKVEMLVRFHPFEIIN